MIINKKKIAVYRLFFLAIILFLWTVMSIKLGSYVIPSPSQTFYAARRMLAEGRLSVALWESLTVYLIGYFFAVLIAVPLGFFMGAFNVIGKTLDIFVFALSATPRVAFIPLIIILLGLGVEAKVFIVFLGAIIPILINSYAGILAADQELVEMAKSVGASRTGIFFSIVLPGAFPYVMIGLRLGATIGLINTVVAELYTAINGLGGLLALYGNTFRMAEYFVVVIMLALVGVAITEGLKLIENQFKIFYGSR
ncbi:MAG: ABC transporter permease subunit [Proteobacteria bacterium]|nr:ABC transporter permease subunit [Pseudomonadota bacterium]